MGHERVLTVRGIAELVARVMDHEWEIVSVPADRLPPTNPYAPPYPIVYDLSRIRLTCNPDSSAHRSTNRGTIVHSSAYCSTDNPGVG